MNTLTNASNPPTAMRIVPSPKFMKLYSKVKGITFGTKGAAPNRNTTKKNGSGTPAMSKITKIAAVNGNNEPSNAAIRDFIPNNWINPESK